MRACTWRFHADAPTLPERGPVMRLRSTHRIGTSRRELLTRGLVASASTAAAAAAAGCGAFGSGGAGQQAASTAASGKVTWYVRTDANENRWQNEVAIPAMRQKHPGLTLEVSPV